MATKESIAVRRDLASMRIADALARLRAVDPELPDVNLEPLERDLDERNAVLLENIATGFEYLVSQIMGNPTEPTEPEQPAEEPTEPEPPSEEPVDGAVSIDASKLPEGVELSITLNAQDASEQPAPEPEPEPEPDPEPEPAPKGRKGK